MVGWVAVGFALLPAIGGLAGALDWYSEKAKAKSATVDVAPPPYDSNSTALVPVPAATPTAAAPLTVYADGVVAA